MLPALFAQFAPLSAAAQWAVISILTGTLLILSISAFFRRKPPLDSELVKLNLAIDGLQKSVESLTSAQQTHASHASEIEALEKKVAVLEQHRENDQHAQRKYTRETTQEIFNKIDGLKDSFSSNLQRVERALGNLEGKVEGLK